MIKGMRTVRNGWGVAALSLGAALIWAPKVQAQQACAALPTGARLAIAGDSITEQKLYSRYVETYLLACAGRRDVSVFQFGWGGETAGGFAGRMSNDLAMFKPTAATLCYGMNDGGYRPYEESIGQTYAGRMLAIVSNLLGMGVSVVVVGSPGAVDTKYFQRASGAFGAQSAADGYNASLGQLRDLDEKLAARLKLPFADVHGAMTGAMTRAKAALGTDYDVCGRDGVHPGPNGQLCMAYAFLKALACDGLIGEIVVDLKAGATASPGHKVLSAAGGKVAIESERYPFCFEGDATASSGTRSILPFLPFNQDLNRFMLKVTGLDAPRAKVAWGEVSREFTREQLAAGVNLAAEFDRTPFDAAFQAVAGKVAQKQGFETPMIKSAITQFRWLQNDLGSDAELQSALKVITQRLAARRAQLEAEVRAALVPVKHTLTVTALP